MALAVSPLAPERFPDIPVIPGVRFAAGCTGMRYRNRDDLMLAELAPGTTVAGVFTRSATASAPVLWCRASAKRGRGRAMVVNAGNANTFTGSRGAADVKTTAAAAAKLLGCAAADIFVSSTGIIGQRLPVETVVAALPGLQAQLDGKAWEAAARAITTTDTYPKGSTAQAKIGGVTVTIGGFAKGSGMIAPDMATMLAYVFTDAALPVRVLQQLLREGADRSFNSITVDSDTSTSDTLLLAATGKAGNKKITRAGDPALKDFRAKLDTVLLDLALQIVRDGEGAQKLITVRVNGAASSQAARKIGLSVANSPLVKTAVAAADANWGRIVAAVGKAGEKANRDRMKLGIGGILIARNGEPVTGYDEAPVTQHMKGRDVVIEIDVGVGKGRATVWGCDLTHGYIEINGSYRS
ncbi:MAG: bifunctional glutamate N-acetyltransferase/amino-acid acetyltransferase ArgJ [Alphaproteobacteria bacterium]|nr:bifunctional glutamate N-acetyltransferase/amino-acid acetyltransferase ArgJ [Alphaproteobacteria bacterium]